MSLILRRRATILVALVSFIAAMIATPAPAQAAATQSEIASYWAPVHYQDVDAFFTIADYITPVNFDPGVSLSDPDGWKTANNWENLAYGRWFATVYYSVVETSTNWFIVYAFYHPVDWCKVCHESMEHENDMEGILLTVSKNGTTYGKLQSMITVYHNDFYSYTPSGSDFKSSQYENIDGTIRMKSYGGHNRPTTFQQAQGHGIKAWNGEGFPGGDGIIYNPGTTAQEPTSANQTATYKLVNIFATNGLWAHQVTQLNNPSITTTFAGYGTFRGDDGTANAAHAPWGWDDGDDRSVNPKGDFALNPVRLIYNYFDWAAGHKFATDKYTVNGYCAAAPSKPCG
ncbi:MAG TPA: hypothetical protein VFV09_09945 [Actinomycetota bacterium]|jgi:hypothetical protein|nr:hypothetical protein [Actinomycetota bacterium]